MATRNEAGAVHINTAFFCFSPDLALYFLSHPNSVHCHNLRRVPHMAVAVFDSHQAWGDPLVGLQLFGAGALVPDEAVPRVRALYAARFPRSGEFLRHRADQAPQPATFGALQFYRFAPERIQLLDEWEFGDEVFVTATVVP